MRILRILEQITLLVFVISVSAGCSKLFPAESVTGTGRGVVRRIDLEHHQITLSHGTVQNLLHPMTFAYPVKSDKLMQGISVSDTVSFSIRELKPGSFLIESLAKAEHRGSGKPTSRR